MTASRCLLLSACALAVPAFAQQQPDPITDVTITGHVYEPQPVPPTDARIQQLTVPSGFAIHRFAEGLENPRMIAVAEDGTVYVTQRTPGNLVMLKDLDGDGVVDAQRVVANVKDLHGIEIRGRKIYLVDVHRIYSADLRADGFLGPLSVVSRGLPDAGQHPNRTLRFSPEGELFVSVGSTCNACDEPNPENATLERVDLNTGKREIFASGLRNTIGFDWHPGSSRLYGMDQGIDWLGDDEQIEELNEIKAKTMYGWPFVYGEDKFNPQDEPPDVTQLYWAKLSEEPVAGYTAHAAPMQMQFYRASQFPSEYRDSAFFANHGSWNRKPPSGYNVVRAVFNASGAFVSFEPFVSGFLQPQPNTAPPLPGAQPWPPEGFIGRPTGIATARDGALLVGDDTNNMIYRVMYGSATPAVTPQALATQLVAAQSDQPVQVRSTAFQNGGAIPLKYTDYNQGKSPPLSWSAVPGAQAYVLMMEDPDATSPIPFEHWLAVIPANVIQLPEDVDQKVEFPSDVPGMRQGSNSHSQLGYFGPRPPAAQAPHHYHFQIFALDTHLNLPSGFNRHTTIKALQGHVLAKGEIVGTFTKQLP
ncbi:MAG: YbhB/YbcL family Raf kinase inhibitor-like protein [Povalibacter sp.]